MTHLKVPHGFEGMRTTRLSLQLPRGVASARPEVPFGWSVNMSEYDLAEEDRYMSHGAEVVTAPDKITWVADSLESALQHDHLLQIGLQLKLLCSFSDPVTDDYSGTNSIWQGQYTLWFKVDQWLSAAPKAGGRIDRWIGAQRDNPDGTSPPWNPVVALGNEGNEVGACPYLFLHAGEACAEAGGMRWMGSLVPPAENRAPILHEQHVIDLATEAVMTAQESLEQSLDEVHAEAHEHIHELEERLHELEHNLEKIQDKQDPPSNNVVIGLSTAAFGFSLICTLIFLWVSHARSRETRTERSRDVSEQPRTILTRPGEGASL